MILRITAVLALVMMVGGLQAQGFKLKKLDLKKAPQAQKNSNATGHVSPSRSTQSFAQVKFRVDMNGQLWVNGEMTEVKAGQEYPIKIPKSFRYYFITEDKYFVSEEFTKKLKDHQKGDVIDIYMPFYEDYQRLMREEKLEDRIQGYMAVVKEYFVHVDGRNIQSVFSESPLPEGFEISKYEVTYAHFKQFREWLGESNYESQGSLVINRGSLRTRAMSRGANWTNDALGESIVHPYQKPHPVVNVTWEEAMEYCAWLSQQDAYYTYRLPYEKEWRYIMKDQPSKPIDWIANTADASLSRNLSAAKKYDASITDGHPFTSPVGSFKPTQYGLYDMYGNVAEWLMDNEKENSDRIGDRKKFIGGSYFVMPDDCLSKKAYSWPANQGHGGIGFRVCRVPK